MQRTPLRISGSDLDEIIINPDSPVYPLAAALVEQPPKERFRTLKQAAVAAKHPGRLERGLNAAGQPEGRRLTASRQAVRLVAPILLAHLARGASIHPV